LAVYKDKGNAVAVIPCVEAVFKSEDGLSSNETIPREELWRTQTPHTFRLKDLLWAHEMAAEYKIINMAATCSLFQALGKTIHFSKGAETNLKITTQEDLEIFKALLYMQKGATN
jgi:2-C-methyl-D-erythritol 4-phosphate cytidylyltransferase